MQGTTVIHSYASPTCPATPAWKPGHRLPILVSASIPVTRECEPSGIVSGTISTSISKTRRYFYIKKKIDIELKLLFCSGEATCCHTAYRNALLQLVRIPAA